MAEFRTYYTQDALFGIVLVSNALIGIGQELRAAGVLKTELTAAGSPHDLKVYPGTKHSFFNDTLPSYHAVAAADSWQRILAFFSEHVRRGSPRSA